MRGLSDHQPRFGSLDTKGDSAGRERREQRYVHSAQTPERKQRNDQFGPLPHQDGYPVAAANSTPAQRRCQSSGLVCELTEREGYRAHVIGVDNDERHPVAVVVVAEHRGDRQIRVSIGGNPTVDRGCGAEHGGSSKRQEYLRAVFDQWSTSLCRRVTEDGHPPKRGIGIAPTRRRHLAHWQAMSLPTSAERFENPQVVGSSTMRALARLRKVTGVDLTFSGIPQTEVLRVLHFDGPVAGPLRSAPINAGHGLGGRVLVSQRPIALSDYVSAESILHTYDQIIRAERLRTMVAAPVIIGRRVHSVLYAASRSPQTELGRLFDAVTAEARALEHNLVIESALAARSPDTHPVDSGAQLESSYQELRAIAADITDPTLRQRIQAAADRLIKPEPQRPTNLPPVHLTPREHEVLTLVASGLPNAVIAEYLATGLYTVKAHLKNLTTKLGARNLFEAVVNARRAHLLP